MDRAEALKLLSATAPDDRLRAARALCRTATEQDIPVLEVALAGETQRWIKGALLKALQSLRPGPDAAFVQAGSETDEERMIEQIYAEAVEDTTHRLVHEISAIIGRLDVYAGSEFSSWRGSRTRTEWSRLQQLVGAIDRLSQAAAAPEYSDFNLVDVIEKVVFSECTGQETKVAFAGPKPLLVFGAAELIQIIVGNAVRNALEAVTDLPMLERILVTWGETDVDYWIAILDRGRGLPETTQNVFEIGATTKRGHLGMGLALARQAALSMTGRISLTPRKDGGARFEVRWPKSSV
ncbi:MAG TPA: HAMP domain-containing sensor histidine kinase [Chthoniobacterales bacterium]|jgi:signal transduction histidine kinase|nr:HAMP domain-containing sensor histidine kinase [Chthoniobacterales bacterium]